MESSAPIIVKPWVDSMEQLFKNLRVPERDQVSLAVPFLDKMAHRWWKVERARQDDASTDLGEVSGTLIRHLLPR